jgi:hypothetical protein
MNGCAGWSDELLRVLPIEAGNFAGRLGLGIPVSKRWRNRSFRACHPKDYS